MRITDNFLNKIEKKTNVSKDTILDMASKLNSSNMKDKSVITDLIDNLSKITGKKVTEEQKNKIVSTIIKDEIPEDLDKMI